MECPYCHNEAVWCENKEIYGRNYGNSYMVWFCKPCDAFVGCHNNTKKPLGTMANKAIREARKKVHAHIDSYWKTGQIQRGQLYALLSQRIGKNYHTGESDVEMCNKILAIDMQELLGKPVHN